MFKGQLSEVTKEKKSNHFNGLQDDKWSQKFKIKKPAPKPKKKSCCKCGAKATGGGDSKFGKLKCLCGCDLNPRKFNFLEEKFKLGKKKQGKKINFFC